MRPVGHALRARSAPAVPADRLRTVLRLLLRAGDAARRSGCRRADLALRRDCLLAQGADEATLRLLVDTGHAAYAPQSGRRRRPGSRLFLTEQGAAFARHFLGDDAEDVAAERPSWRGELGELWWGGVCVKRFRHEAANQRCVLDAFEKEGWPACLPDPFPSEPGLNAKTRLRETVKSLNQGQERVRFRMDGTGRSVRWEAVS